MPCSPDEDGTNNDGDCLVQDLCVCQWAFAAYLQKAVGCDSIQEIVCEARLESKSLMIPMIVWCRDVI